MPLWLVQRHYITYHKNFKQVLRYFGADKDAIPLICPSAKNPASPEFSPQFTHNEDFLTAFGNLALSMAKNGNPDAQEACALFNSLKDNWLKAVTVINYKEGDVAIINQRATVRGIMIDGLHEPDVQDRYLLSTTAKLGDELAMCPALKMHHAEAILQCSQIFSQR